MVRRSGRTSRMNGPSSRSPTRCHTTRTVVPRNPSSSSSATRHCRSTTPQWRPQGRRSGGAVAGMQLLPHGRRLRSLVSRLLLAAAPVAVVVALLVGLVAAPLLRAPSDVARSERELVEVQHYQALLNLVDEQTLHWSEYQYLPRAQPQRDPGGDGDESSPASPRCVADWRRCTCAGAGGARRPTSSVRRDGEDRASRVDAGRTASSALRVMADRVRPAVRESAWRTSRASCSPAQVCSTTRLGACRQRADLAARHGTRQQVAGVPLRGRRARRSRRRSRTSSSARPPPTPISSPPGDPATWRPWAGGPGLQ